jgi:hypothetical protein
MDGSTSAYVGACRKDIPYPSVSHESVPSLIDNLVSALYGSITKTVVNRRVQWNIPCDPNNTATINNIPRNAGEGLLCYIIRALNLTGAGGIVTVDGTQTLTNKTLTAPILNNAPILSAGSTAARTLENRFSDVVNVKDFGAVGDGTTDDTLALRAARTFAETNGTSIYWPDGDYFTTGSINRLHTIRHFGDGAITSTGGYRFWLQPKKDQTNTIYVSPSGTTDNDGLTPSQPLDISVINSSLLNYGSCLNGTWIIQHAAGTYTKTFSLIGVRSSSRIKIQGPSVFGGTPTAIYDGNTSTDYNGMFLSTYIYVQVQDIKFQNWVYSASASSGLVATYFTDIYCVNVHATNCNFTGIAGDTFCHLYVQGGNISNCLYGVRAYGQTNFIIGYGSSPTTITGCTGAGFYVRDSSAGDVLSCTFNANNAIGILLTNQSRARISNCTISGNTTGIQANIFSTYYNNNNTLSGNTTNFINQWSTDLDSIAESTFDPVYKSFKWGQASGTTNKYHFKNNTSGASFSSGTQMIFEDTSPIFGLAGNGSGNYGIQCSSPSSSSFAYLLYVSTDNTWRLKANNTEAYRFSTTSFIPLPDNTIGLGAASSRWSTVYAGTGTINTSDEREKQQIEFIDPAVLTAWKKVNFKQFKFNDAVEKKGDKARLHFGVIAQQVKEAFESEGLDAFEYGLLCYDEWEETPEEKDEEGNIRTAYRPAGNRYGVRYEEALALECAYQRIVTESLLQRIEALESR